MSISVLEGSAEGKHLRVAIVLSRFNEMVTDRLLQGAQSELIRLGVREENLSIFKVPGAFELPILVKKLCQRGGFDAIVCLGAIIRGETPHFDHICQSAISGISKLNLEYQIPIVNGIITANNVEQALNRSGLKNGNLGINASRTAVEMANLLKRIEG